MDGITNIIRNLGVPRLITLSVVTISMLAFFFIMLGRVSQPSMSLLYGNLEQQEAGQIVQRLDAMGVPYDIRGESQIWAPDNRVGQLRLQMAAEGLVGTSTKGYEIFDEGSMFGTTSMVQDINARRALEGELSRTISSLPVVSQASVHLVMPKRELFSRVETPPSASVKLDLGSRVLSPEQVTAITHLVAAAVPNMEPAQVTVVDNRGNLLTSEAGLTSTGGALDANASYREKIESEFENQIAGMLERIVGPGKVNVAVTADMEFGRVEENAEIFDPEGQVARSEQSTTETREAESNTPTPPVGVAGNVPGEEAGGGMAGTTDTSTVESETVNYEISRTIRKSVNEGGSINSLSVAVLVEGGYTNVDGEEQYVPMTDERRAQIESLVQSAIGYDAERGDQVEIVDMPFNALPEEDSTYEEPFLNKAEIMRLVEYGLLFIGLLIMVFFVVRPILKAAGKSSPRQVQQPQAAQQSQAAPEEEESPETMIDLDKVEGRVRESTVRKVTEIIDSHPDESVQVVRSWMSPESS